MKINVYSILPEGSHFSERISAGELDLETDLIKIEGPVRIDAELTRITNAVTVQLSIAATLLLVCSRCLKEVEKALDKEITLSIPIEKGVTAIDLSDDIREEIILDYPVKFLCKDDCKGLCPKCGKDLNEGPCNCKI